MLRVIRGVAALLVWIVAGEMREQEGTQQIKFKAAEMRVHVMWDTPEPPPLLNHHAHRAAMECAPNFFGTWTVEKPFKRETGTVLKWSWQRVVGFLLVTLCFSCSMWAIICNVSDPHEFYSWGCLKKAGTHTHVHTFRPEEETVAADECLFITCLQHQRGGASEQDDSGEVGRVVSHTERLRSVLNVFHWRMDVLEERCARENQPRCFILVQLWLLLCLFHISDI